MGNVLSGLMGGGKEQEQPKPPAQAASAIKTPDAKVKVITDKSMDINAPAQPVAVGNKKRATVAGLSI